MWAPENSFKYHTFFCQKRNGIGLCIGNGERRGVRRGEAKGMFDVGFVRRNISESCEL